MKTFAERLIEAGDETPTAHDRLSEDDLAALDSASLEHVASIYEFQLKALDQAMEGDLLDEGGSSFDPDAPIDRMHSQLHVLVRERLAYIRGLLAARRDH